MTPLVSVLIVTRNRPAELHKTLMDLRLQAYSPLELIVVDDASDEPIAPLVRRHWPSATVVRNDTNRGLIASRSAALRLARGEFIVSLDDDSCLTAPDDLERAIDRMTAEPALGILTFFVHHGAVFERPASPAVERYVHTFIGCAHMMRRAMVERIGTYRDEYFYYGEEWEYGLRALDAGWRILFFPRVAVHHRVSSSGRTRARVWGYSVRNNLSTILLRMPARRLPVELGWKLAVNALELVRTLEIGAAGWALGSLLARLPSLLRDRRAISVDTLRRYDALRLRVVSSAQQLEHPRRASFSELASYLRTTWWNRRRGRPFWDRRPGGIGRATTASFELEPHA